MPPPKGMREVKNVKEKYIWIQNSCLQKPISEENSLRVLLDQNDLNSHFQKVY